MITAHYDPRSPVPSSNPNDGHRGQVTGAAQAFQEGPSVDAPSTLTCDAPPAAEMALDTTAAQLNGTPPPGREVVLLVDDEPAVLQMAAAILTSQGFTVLGATNGCDGLRLAREQAGAAVRLVITDVFMPQMGGKEMVEQLHADRPDLKVVYTSGYLDDILSDQVLDPAGYAFLAKPYTPAMLISTVRRLLEHA